MQPSRIATLAALAVSGGAIAAGVAMSAPGDLSVASLSSTGTQGASAVEAEAVSANGRFVAFTSVAVLDGGPTGGKRQLYVRDLQAGTTKLASTSAAGVASNGDVEADGGVANIQFAISGDGRFVAFAAAGSNLSPADTDAGLDVFRKDMTTGAITLISVNSAGVKANAAVLGDPDISADGSRVVFGSGQATNLVSADGNGANSDVMVRDVTAGTTVLASVTSTGGQPGGATERPAISADGRVVAFEAPAGTADIVPDDTGLVNDIYVRNLAAGTTVAASDPTKNAGSSFPDISGDGRYVVFESGFAYGGTNDANNANDAYRRDMGTGTFTVASARDGRDDAGSAASVRPAISADGTRVTFASTSTDLTTDANAGVSDVFVRDLTTKATRLASVRADGTTQSANASDHAAIAANGGNVAFLYNDAAAVTRLVATDANSQPDALLKELAPSDAAGPALSLTGPAGGITVKDAQVAVAGTVTDPSGVATLTVNGNALPLTATGGFSTTALLATGANTITIAATDGAGNVTTQAVTVTRAAPKPAKKVLALSASLVGRRIVVKLNLSVQARVRFTVLRRTVGPKPKRLVTLRRVGKPVLKVVKPGRRTIKLVPPTLAPGSYAVRVQIVGVAGKATTRTDGFRIRAR